MDINEICKFVGTEEKTMQSILDKLVKEDFLKKQGKEYSIK